MLTVVRRQNVIEIYRSWSSGVGGDAKSKQWPGTPRAYRQLIQNNTQTIASAAMKVFASLS